MHPLLDSDPAERTPAREETPTAEAISWLEDPQPPPPPMDRQEAVLRELAEAIGMPFEHMQEAVEELNEYDPQNEERPTGSPPTGPRRWGVRQCLVSRQTKS